MDRLPTDEAYHELQLAYDYFNTRIFEGDLPPCLITLQREANTYGYFSRERFVRRDGKLTDEIAMNPRYFARTDVTEIMQTLVHEMIHLWQFHRGKPSRKGYHNKEWAAKMEEIGLMPSSTGEPGGAKTGQKMADYVIAGGLFDTYCRDLLGDGFSVSWLDRYPAKVSHSNLTLGRPGAAGAGNAEGEPDRPEEGEDGGFAGQLLDAQPQTSNRWKYRCPDEYCRLQVWAKPKAKIKCGEHDLMLNPAHQQEPPP